jgi:hypothetical protein
LKKQLAVTLGLAVLATPAFATKARLAALGESTNGSYFISDNRNIFLNASEVNNHKDFVTYEWGDAAAVDAANTPSAEGGFVINAGSLVYGAQMGRDNGFNAGSQDVSANLPGTFSDYKATNALDLFVGGDAGVKWGANLYYSSQSQDDQNSDTATAAVGDAKTKVMDLSAGIAQGNLAAFVKLGLNGKSTYDDSDVDGDVQRKSDMTIGASYKHMGMTFFAEMASNKYEADVALAADDEEIKNNSMSLGAAKIYKLNDKSNLFAKVSYNTTKQDVDSTDVSTKTKTLPATVGLETDATSWLTLRGSIGQNIMGTKDVDGTKNTIAESTVVNAGASLKFGDLSVDGLIGNNTDGSSPEADTSEGNGQLRTDSLMSRVSMTYKF